MKKVLAIVLIIISFIGGIFIGEKIKEENVDVQNYFNVNVELYGCPRSKKVLKPNTIMKFFKKF